MHSPRFAIPFMFSTTLGLSAVALRGDPAMATLSAADVSAGLPAPAAAAALLGKGGAAALLVVLFLAVTSATSAELIAVSSILTFDVYKVRARFPSAGPDGAEAGGRNMSIRGRRRCRFCACRMRWWVYAP